MPLRLNGWQRLWVVISILYLVLVAGFAILLWPTAATTGHRAEFLTRLPAELQAQIEAAYDSEYSWKGSLKRETANIPPPPDYALREGPLKFTPGVKTKEAIPLPPRFTLVSAPVSFPNGAILQVHVAKEGDTEPDVRVGPAYWAIIEAEVRAARWAMVWQAALVWLAPCLTLYALGWATAWVRRGFRGSASGPDPRGPKGGAR